MTLEEMKAFMPDGTSDDALQKALDKFNDEAKKMVENETKGLTDNKTKLLDQMAKLKKNQVPDGFDNESYQTYLKEKDDIDKKKKELEDKELEGKGQWEALKLKMSESHQTAISDLTSSKDEEISFLKKSLDKELIENNAIKAIEKEKGNSFFLLPHMKNQIKTIKSENGFEVQVMDKEGNQRFADDAQTKPFTVNDLVAEMKANDTFAPAFPEMNAGGGGDINTGGGGGKVINPWKAETKNITQQARLNKENPTLAAQLKKAAGVS